uniref:RNA-directed DNA polymerase, eukaryota, reverse transcriptase zinc-binding domain protein n=1 Tax=Tanacetum cinerariifolium TaxID=118510 RepID=A0A6L2KPJ2_TANCI|nr:RNA-directed DNA polymerase, eukaryota, reverse transcriptase zinc-binding domain protein [Tanacetum cinerariifolium]
MKPTDPNPKQQNLNPKTSPIFTNTSFGKPSFVSVVNGSSSTGDSNIPTKIRSISLKDQDLVSIDDSSKVLLVKLKDVDSMSNMYSICRNEGLENLKIHHVGGLWIWIQFPSTASRTTFQGNECMKSFSLSFKNVSPSFKVDERLIWFEISGLPLCAWGSATFKKTSDDECKEKKVDAPEDAKSVDDLDDLLNDLNENKMNHEDIPQDVNEPLNKKCDTQYMEENTNIQRQNPNNLWKQEGGVGDEEVVVGEGVVVTSSSLEMLTNSCLGGIMVSLIFLEGLEEEALVEFIVEWFEKDENGKKNRKKGVFSLKA